MGVVLFLEIFCFGKACFLVMHLFFFFFINYKGNFSGGIFLGDGRFWFFLGR